MFSQPDFEFTKTWLGHLAAATAAGSPSHEIQRTRTLSQDETVVSLKHDGCLSLPHRKRHFSASAVKFRPVQPQRESLKNASDFGLEKRRNRMRPGWSEQWCRAGGVDFVLTIRALIPIRLLRLRWMLKRTWEQDVTTRCIFDISKHLCLVRLALRQPCRTDALWVVASSVRIDA